MKKLIFLLVILSIAAAGFGVYNYFRKFNRASNPDMLRPELVVFASSSFVSPYGPGAFLETEFEKLCLCDVIFVDHGGTELLFQKLQFEGTVVDVVLGLDQVSLKRAAQVVKWRPLKVPQRQWQDIFENNYYKTFLPYDWSPMTFIFKDDEGLNSATTIKEFLRQLPEKSLILQDPDLSTPGLQFVRWFRLLPMAFVDLPAKVQRLAPDWSAAYGLFRNGQAKATFTYLTSLVYHWDHDKDFSYSVANFEEGHIAQIEYAAVPDICRSCGLAERFVEFLSEDKVQAEIMHKNFMLPIVKNVGQGTSFEKLPQLKIIEDETLDALVDRQSEVIQEFRKALGSP